MLQIISQLLYIIQTYVGYTHLLTRLIAFQCSASGMAAHRATVSEKGCKVGLLQFVDYFAEAETNVSLFSNLFGIQVGGMHFGIQNPIKPYKTYGNLQQFWAPFVPQ